VYEARLPPRSRLHGFLTLLGWIVALLLPVAAVVAIVLLASGGSTRSSRIAQESIFQDDDHLLYASTATVTSTLDTLRGLGVDRVRLTILWRDIAPAPNAAAMPAGFQAADPAAYPAGAWAPYDRVVELAGARGIKVAFNVTAPGPAWAMATAAPSARYASHFQPSAADFGAFVTAVGRRYSGDYRPPTGGSGTAGGSAGATPLPRVSFWTIWNEPNQPGWLAPQWQSAGGTPTPVAAQLYRGLADAAYAALRHTGHVRDTILIGELAPEGSESDGAESAMPPMVFLRALYCLNGAYKPLRGGAAIALGCPIAGGRSFVVQHPVLFRASGFAHHPYSFFLAPQVSLPDENFVPLADLGRLERGLDRSLAAWGIHRRLPLYLTEYGYETNPPNPYRGVPLRVQSLYLNQAQYIVSHDPRVRSMAQFLLYDAGPNTSFPKGSIGYWSTFQTGLLFADGQPKLSLNSYRLPIFIPDPSVSPGGTITVWGMLRLAPNRSRQRADIQWRPKVGSYRTLARVTTDSPVGYLTARVALPAAGAIRITWVSPRGTMFRSRSVGVS
jgi:hypothetical protein